jgi:S1-C subfamily serine protease
MQNHELIRARLRTSRMNRVRRPRNGRATPALLAVCALAIVAAPLVWREVSAPDAATGNLASASLTQLPRRRVAAADSIDSSRRTAIVRAAERVAPAVVSVNVLRRETVRPRSYFDNFLFGPYARESQSLGSGFVIDASGNVVTNEHVVRGATEIVVTLGDGRDFRAEVVGVDEVTDIALLRLTDPRPTNLPVAPLGSSASLVIGEWAIAIGNPFGNLLSNAEPTVTAGVISGVGDAGSLYVSQQSRRGRQDVVGPLSARERPVLRSRRAERARAVVRRSTRGRKHGRRQGRDASFPPERRC